MRLSGNLGAGFSFVETLAVLAVSAILASQVGAAAFKMVQRARVANARTQIESFKAALQLYYIDCGSFPTGSRGLRPFERGLSCFLFLTDGTDRTRKGESRWTLGETSTSIGGAGRFSRTARLRAFRLSCCRSGRTESLEGRRMTWTLFRGNRLFPSKKLSSGFSLLPSKMEISALGFAEQNNPGRASAFSGRRCPATAGRVFILSKKGVL